MCLPSKHEAEFKPQCHKKIKHQLHVHKSGTTFCQYTPWGYNAQKKYLVPFTREKIWFYRKKQEPGQRNTMLLLFAFVGTRG
jgi:hypothetical protein